MPFDKIFFGFKWINYLFVGYNWSLLFLCRIEIKQNCVPLLFLYLNDPVHCQLEIVLESSGHFLYILTRGSSFTFFTAIIYWLACVGKRMRLWYSTSWCFSSMGIIKLMVFEIWPSLFSKSKFKQMFILTDWILMMQFFALTFNFW